MPAAVVYDDIKKDKFSSGFYNVRPYIRPTHVRLKYVSFSIMTPAGTHGIRFAVNELQTFFFFPPKLSPALRSYGPMDERRFPNAIGKP